MPLPASGNPNSDFEPGKLLAEDEALERIGDTPTLSRAEAKDEEVVQ